MPIAVVSLHDHNVLSLNRTCSGHSSAVGEKGQKQQAVVSFCPNSSFRCPSRQALHRERVTSDACITESTEDLSVNSESTSGDLAMTSEHDAHVTVLESPSVQDLCTQEQKTEPTEEAAIEQQAKAPAVPAPQPETPVSVQGSTTPEPPTRRRTSIIKISPTDTIPVKQGRFAWKQLPKPDLAKIHSQSLPTPQPKPVHDTPKRRRTVVFSEIQIRNYDQTVGDNPSVSYGPPIQLDWNYQEAEPISVDDYENNRGPRRNTRQMILNYYNRKNLLTYRFGVTEQELITAEQEVNKVKLERGLTRYFLPAQKVEEVMQSIGRKTMRLAGKKC